MSDLYPDCTCHAPDDAEPEDYDADCPEHPWNRGVIMSEETDPRTRIVNGEVRRYTTEETDNA